MEQTNRAKWLQPPSDGAFMKLDVNMTVKTLSYNSASNKEKKFSYRRETALQGGGLEATYADHRKAHNGLPISENNELFFARYNGLGTTSEYRL